MFVEFNREEMNELIYSAREATIRFKRARTELRNGNDSYSQWDEELLDERIVHYSNLEDKLVAKYQAVFNEEW